MSIEKKRAAVAAAEAAAEMAAEHLEAVRAELRSAESVRRQEPAPGSEIRILVRFAPGEREYVYLALRASNPREFGANWYVTGQKGKVTWDHLLALVERGTYRIELIN